jgi:hypothetical protein
MCAGLYKGKPSTTSFDSINLSASGASNPLKLVVSFIVESKKNPNNLTRRAAEMQK